MKLRMRRDSQQQKINSLFLIILILDQKKITLPHFCPDEYSKTTELKFDKKKDEF